MNATHFSPYLSFDRNLWSDFRKKNGISLDHVDLTELQGLNEQLSLTEIDDIYVPLSHLLRLHYMKSQELHRDTNTFLQQQTKKVPFIIGIAGSVAVGKSTTARILHNLIAQWPNQPRVELVTTDGFLYPNEKLEELGIMTKKGFPESFDVAYLFRFLSNLKSGQETVQAPLYSHMKYNVLEHEQQTLHQPDVVIVEGINVLQPPKLEKNQTKTFISDFFDYAMYIDAEEEMIEHWYKHRFQLLRQTAFQNAESYFNKYADLSDEEASEVADRIWKQTNRVNLLENILPTKNRADLILRKGEGHAVKAIHVRKL
ncbi:pantothenate kinase [Geomicrobium sp. JCM 19037]|uniref:type I pantothenate kinase n=1 Tax=Geomicrobium sp. JCM 19037 TaxID=1460634 RepID=UPI00045F3BB2|nr:type I pantothenate kinase [Geomicrobium sp. JCM 19037]GAK05854.1 pantothenate kinase [Geomicrobium sp. JCM 19037]